jgi:ATP-dependent helicase/nuclease subunit A
MKQPTPSALETADAQAREQALDVGHSYMVQAPAGSGKTTVLTQRYLRLLTTVDEPEQVLAITFTRKAAGEMRERVQKALEGAIAVRSDADRVTLELAAAVRAHATARAWGLEESSARLRIQTIDAFNAYLANAMPVTSRNGFGRGIADEPNDLYALAARETLRDAETDPELRLPFERIMRRVDDNWSLLERLIASMLARRAEWLPNLPELSGKPLVPLIEASLEAIVAEDLAAALALLPADFIAMACATARTAAFHRGEEAEPDLAQWRDAASTVAMDITELPRWRALRGLSLTNDGTPRSRLTKAQGLPADDPDARALGAAFAERLSQLDAAQIAALEMLGALPNPAIPEAARAALDALGKLLLLAAGQLTRIFNEQGECDHPEIAGAARRALTEDSAPTPLAERLGTRISHILVDEFQDTSRDQYELLLTLTQDWSEGDGRTLFLVGDPMQSIYGFRNAEVGRFSTVRATGLGAVRLHSLELRRNFRSAAVLVEWCNEIFARVFPAADDTRRSAVRHLASVAARTGLQGESPRLYRVDADGGAPAEAAAAAELIAELSRTRPDETIAVLAGARTHLRAIRAALATRAVPFIGINLEPLADVAAVRDLEALARALESPLDRVAWLAVLRAPFVGLSLPDLTVVAESAHQTTVPNALSADILGLSPDGMERLVRVKSVLLAAWQERELEPRAHLVERAWLALGGPSACAHAEELGSARRFLLALDEEDRKRLRGRPLDFERLMNRLYAQDPALPGAVSLMTIHGAKGLEFDHVFVLGVGRRGRGDEARLLNWLELPRSAGGDHLLMAPIRVRDEVEQDDTINSFIELLHKERAKAERSRLAYVALTRARRSLHLYLHPRVRDSIGAPEFTTDARTLLQNLWPAIGADLAALPVIGAPQESSEIAAATTQKRRRLVRRFAAPAAPPDVAVRGELVPIAAEEEDIEFSWARQTARRVGTVVHEALERFGQGPLPVAADLPRLQARLASRLEALGVAGDAAIAGSERALAALRATLEDARGRWLFDPAHRDAQSELALTGLRGGHIINAVIDRTFVADGVRWVVDFKSSPHEGGDLQAFLDSEAKRYEAQLRRYAHLAKELGPEPVRAGLYFPLLSAWREVDAG